MAGYIAAALQALPALLAAGAAGALAWHDRGSTAPAAFLPYAAAGALLLASVLAVGRAPLPARSVLRGGGALAALALWIGISATWAPVQSVARDEALRLLLGVFVLMLAALTGASARGRTTALAGVVIVLVVLATASVVTLDNASSINDVFRFGRLSFPITYTNATAALFLLGLWPTVVAAANRRAPVVLRACALGAGSCLAAVAALAQSKGSVVGLGLSALAVLAAASKRVRLALWLVAALTPTAVFWSRLSGAYSIAGGAGDVDAMHRAASAVIPAALLGLAIGLVLTLLDRRIQLRPHTLRLINIGSAIAVIAACVAAVGAFAIHVEHPLAWASSEWRNSTRLPPDLSRAPATHLVEFGSNRYDFWRVGVHEWLHHPIVGDGGGGFGPAYLLHGRSGETPTHAHSLPIELLSEEGLVGLLLAIVGFAFLFVGLARRSRAGDLPTIAALGAAVCVLGQALFDWTFTFPAVSVLFFVVVGIGLAGGRAHPVPAVPARAAAAIVLAVGLLVLLPTWLSTRLVSTGLAARDSADLRWARRLDPVSVQPLIAEAEIAATPAAAIKPLEQARQRAPRMLAVRYLLGSAFWHAGKRQAALAELRSALALHPHDGAVERAIEIVRRRTSAGKKA